MIASRKQVRLISTKIEFDKFFTINSTQALSKLLLEKHPTATRAGITYPAGAPGKGECVVITEDGSRYLLLFLVNDRKITYVQSTLFSSGELK